MKVDGGLDSRSLAHVGRKAKELEDVGYDGAFSAETECKRQ